jgi:undecaprenyl-diphosphatase
MDILLTLDRGLFLTINHLPHLPLTDWLALFFSGVGSAGFIWVSLGFWLFLREEKKDHRFFAPFVFVILVSGLFSEVILKFLFSRLRPSPELGAIVVGDGAGWYSFPSSHATIAWAMAVVLSRYEPRFRWAWYVLALAISFTRIYLGVHYPFDVVTGGILGSIIGIWALYILSPRQKKKRAHNR